MRRALCIIIAGLLYGALPLSAAEDYLNFYKEEAEVVSASLRPQPAQQTPATVYVVTQQDIKDSGAITIPDALRNVPGVDVTQFRTGQEEVGIRGLSHAWTNRVLVLMDGRTVLDGFFDHIAWESLPLTMDEIDRIEVVEGPASAVYGPNAASGVINIITKTPEQVQGGKTTFTGGERSTYQGSVLYGKKDGPVSYRMNGGWRSANRFENASSLATEAGLFNGLINYDFGDRAGISFSGGFNNYNTLNSLGTFGLLDDKGMSSYTRADAHYEDTHLRTYWNRGRTDPQSLLSTTPLNYDQYDVQADQSISLPFKNQVVFGATYHRNTATAEIMNNGNPVHQDLWSAFFEDKWEMAERWMLMASGRVDRHPLTPIRFSPRGSLLFTPVPEHVFRVSAGTAYRNPTLLENYFSATQSLPTGNPFLPTITNRFVGSQTLSPETMDSVEVSHTGRFQRVKTEITGFYYRYKNFIQYAPIFNPGNLFAIPPILPSSLTPVVNATDPLTAVGGEIGGEFLVTSSLRVFSNYTYQHLSNDSGSWFPSRGSPRHKANVGLRTKNGGWTTSWAVNWVDDIFQASQITQDPANPNYVKPVGAYFMLNAHVGYAFSGRLNGLEVGVNSFNLLNHDHYEALPPQPGGFNGEEGEIVRSRFTGTVSYKF